MERVYPRLKDFCREKFRLEFQVRGLVGLVASLSFSLYQPLRAQTGHCLLRLKAKKLAVAWPLPSAAGGCANNLWEKLLWHLFCWCFLYI